MFTSILLLFICALLVCFSWFFLYEVTKNHNKNIRRKIKINTTQENILPFYYDTFSQSLSDDAKNLICRIADIDNRILAGEKVDIEYTSMQIEIKELAIKIEKVSPLSTHKDF